MWRCSEALKVVWAVSWICYVGGKVDTNRSEVLVSSESSLRLCVKSSLLVVQGRLEVVNDELRAWAMITCARVKYLTGHDPIQDIESGIQLLSALEKCWTTSIRGHRMLILLRQCTCSLFTTSANPSR